MDAVIYIGLGLVLACAIALLRTRTITFMAQKPQDFEGTGPDFDLRQHLNGPILCEGVIFGPTGRVSSRFVADMHASWDGNIGMMTERFHYDSGTTQDREWRLTLGNDGSIRAEAPDVVGAGKGQQTGAGVQLKYRIRLPVESGGFVLDATDWMYLVENGTIMNRSQFRKYGIKVAELVATMRPKNVSEVPKGKAA
jgi:hypothetical protein